MYILHISGTPEQQCHIHMCIATIPASDRSYKESKRRVSDCVIYEVLNVMIEFTWRTADCRNSITLSLRSDRTTIDRPEVPACIPGRSAIMQSVNIASKDEYFPTVQTGDSIRCDSILLSTLRKELLILKDSFAPHL